MLKCHGDREVLSKILEAPRYACSLGGALQTVLAIDRAIPIVHSCPGCGYNLYLGYFVMGGHQGTGYAGGTNLPCSRLGREEVILGGEEKLRKLIRSSVDIMDADLFVVLAGCAADLIGDDIGSIVGEFSELEVPIFYVETGGFKGNTYRGYELVLEALTDQMMEKSPKIEKGLVNIFGMIPNQDVFWRGNLAEIQRLLGRLGLKANMLLGYRESGLDAWRKIPSSELNIILSPWVGISPAEKLEEKFRVPYLVFPGLPVGPSETARLLRQVAEKLDIHQSVVDEVITDEDREVYYYLENVADTYQDYGMQFDFVIIGDSNYVIGFTKFLTNDMGFIPFTAVITDDPPDKYRTKIISELTNLDYGLKPEVIFESNSGKIWEGLKGSESNLVLGSSIDSHLARLLNAAHLSVAFPIGDRMVINKPYIGYRGCLELIGDIYTAVMQTKY